MKQGYQPTKPQTAPAVNPAHRPYAATDTAFRNETVQLITDIIFRLGDLEERVRKLEKEKQIETASAEESDWLDKIIDEVNASVQPRHPY